MSAVAYKPGKEAGAWYEIRSVANVIKIKAGRGENTDFERSLLEAWAEYPGYESAKEALKALKQPQNKVITPETSKNSGVKAAGCVILPTQAVMSLAV